VTHQATQRIDLANEVPFCRTSNRGIARHVRDCPGGKGAEADAPPEARRRECGLAARMASANYYHIVVLLQ
jgi:hypothetical protein